MTAPRPTPTPTPTPTPAPAPADPAPALSIIVPVLDEAAGIAARLQALAAERQRGAEVVVVDGGSQDGTPERAAPWADQVRTAPRGRASQMNAGAQAARGRMLLFLHADTRLPDGADQLIAQALGDASAAPHDRPRAPSADGSPHTPRWGRFDVRIEGRPRMLRVIGTLMNLRSRWTGIATGDQALFMHREAFERVGGFPDIALMEDIAMSRQLKQLVPPVCLRQRVTTSGRRWERHGVWRTIWLMWRLRAAYALGADPDELAVRYGYTPRPRPRRTMQGHAES